MLEELLISMSLWCSNTVVNEVSSHRHISDDVKKCKIELVKCLKEANRIPCNGLDCLTQEDKIFDCYEKAQM
jgi:hypothetical protein